jgi:hypothetical protein
MQQKRGVFRSHLFHLFRLSRNCQVWPVPCSLGCRDLSRVSSRTPNSLQYPSRTVHATIAVRTVRISPAHHGAAPSAMNGRTFLILRETEGSRFPCISRLPKESRSALSARAVPCGDLEERVSSSASGSAWRSFGPIAATTAIPASGAFSAPIRLGSLVRPTWALWVPPALPYSHPVRKKKCHATSTSACTIADAKIDPVCLQVQP